MKTLKAITTVYSYYLPEIRDLITRMTRDYPHDVFLRSILPGLDDFHVPVMDRLIGSHAVDVPALGQFANRYPTAGSEEGIREYMTVLQGQGVKRIYVWKGDYEGYREVARTRGIEAVDVEFEADPAALPPGHWFLSNPSARNGMIVPREKVLAIAEAGHKVFYDLSYIGTTVPVVYDVAHPNVAVVAVSFSKPYGLFYYRIGFIFSREPVATLYANKWFKNIYGLLIADRIVQEVDQAQLSAKYRSIQAEIVRSINAETGLGLAAADVFLLANMPASSAARLPEEAQSQLNRYRRGDWYRFCLTPYFEEYERSASLSRETAPPAGIGGV